MLFNMKSVVFGKEIRLGLEIKTASVFDSEVCFCAARYF